MPACVIPFDSAAFAPASFERNGIAFPAEVARSVRKRQAEFFHGRLAARHAMAALDVDTVDIPIGPSREPVWPPGVVGSISHSSKLAAAVVLERVIHSGIGIDIEQVIDEAMQASLLGTVVDASELAYLRKLESRIPLRTLLTLAFSAKESLFKAAFPSVGRYFDFAAAKLSRIDPENRCLTLTLQETLSEEFAAAQHCHVHFDFIRADTLITCFAW